ncbi:hypothetical protein [Absidia glauca]|uniref:Uncharacterized protein n=1 Tax=Absidia glauca TaxID=4829 RepID=A0A163KSD5_ABSGL|nr:hypothetical protein [Absidia glauca]
MRFQLHSCRAIVVRYGCSDPWFGMHPFVVQCVGGDEKTKTTCPDHNCSLWNQCTQVWQMAIIWVAITTALSFVLNSVLLYCIHQVRRSEPISNPPPPCKQPYASSFFDYNRPAPRMAPHNPYVSNISEPEGLYIRQSTLK